MKQKQLYIYCILHSFWWNLFLLLISSVCLSVFSLLLAIGNGQQVMFWDYFRYPLTFFLNYLPVFLLQMLLWGIFGRVWIAFLITGLVVMTASAGNFFKMIIRYEPFLASDIPYITTALGVSKEYNLSLNTRFILIIISTGILLSFLIIFAKEKLELLRRSAIVIIVLCSAVSLWQFVYTSEKIYNGGAIVQRDYDHEMYKTASKGFVYPFIYSMKDAFFKDPPKGYDSMLVSKFLASYPDSDIPAEKNPNIVAIQLEAFSDLRTMGIEGISEEAYAIYDELKKESLYGTLIVNVNGGSTIDTEQCFLTGDYAYYKIRKETPSFVWYLKDQGYHTVGGHPFYSFYGRQNTNPLLGFEDYRFVGGYDGYPDIEQLNLGRNFSDSFFFESILKQYQEFTSVNEPVFSFNVTMQGHSPYNTERFLFGENWFDGTKYSDYTNFVMNNYLGSLADTQGYLSKMVNYLREDSKPVFVVLYGDHKPWLGDDSQVAEELNVNYDLKTQDGFINYYSTEYIIWANNAARTLCNFQSGHGPTISICYLFPLLFQKIGWNTCGFANYLLERMETLNVITSHGDFFENGKKTDTLSKNGIEIRNMAEYVQFKHAVE